ncbi:hypothetical protein BDW75DRAFT_235066 [Aspergillus navahoensis]
MGYTTDVTPLYIASLYWNADTIRALMDRCRADDSHWQPSSLDPDLLNRLLEQVGVNEPAAADGSTALHYLVRHLNQIDAARHLIQCGANANAIYHQGNTPLHEVMRGLEPMPSEHLAQSLDAFIPVLVEAGASMDQLNTAGKTPTQVRDEVTESREVIRREREAQQLRMRGRGRGRGRG